MSLFLPTSGPGRSSRSAGRAVTGVGLAWLAALLAACDAGPTAVVTPAGPQILARVGDATLTTDDLHREIERRRTARRAIPAKGDLLREMAENLALAQHAQALGLDREPAVAHEIQSLLVRRLLERDLAARLEAVDPTPAEVEAEYQRTLAHHTRPAKDRLAILFLEAPAQASPARRAEARERLEQARRRFLDPADAAATANVVPGFGSLAVAFSDDHASRHRSGDIGWLESGNFAYRWPKPVLEAGFALPRGGVSDVIETEAGPYLVLKTDSRPAVVKPLTEVESSLRLALQAERRRMLDTTYRRDVAQRMGTTFDEAALAAITLPEPPAKQVAQRAESEPPTLSAHESLGRQNP